MTWTIERHCGQEQTPRAHECPWRYARWTYPPNPDGTKRTPLLIPFRTGLAASQHIKAYPAGPQTEPKREANQ